MKKFAAVLALNSQTQLTRHHVSNNNTSTTPAGARCSCSSRVLRHSRLVPHHTAPGALCESGALGAQKRPCLAQQGACGYAYNRMHATPRSTRISLARHSKSLSTTCQPWRCRRSSRCVSVLTTHTNTQRRTQCRRFHQQQQAAMILYASLCWSQGSSHGQQRACFLGPHTVAPSAQSQSCLPGSHPGVHTLLLTSCSSTGSNSSQQAAACQHCQPAAAVQEI